MPGPGLRRPQRPRDPAPGPGHPNGTGAHRGWPAVRPCAAGRTGPTGKLPGACMKSSSSNSLMLLSKTAAPKKLILTLMRPMVWSPHNQEDRFFHGYYDHYCFLPLYVFCRKQLLVSYQRARARSTAPSMPGRSWLCWLNDCDRSGHKFRIIFRGDSGFCRWRMLLWCERNNVGYIVFQRQEQAPERPHRTAATR